MLGLVLPLALAAGCAGTGLEVRPVANFGTDRPALKEDEPFIRGKAQLAAGYPGLAVANLQEALAREPASVAVLNALAIAFDLVGRYDLSGRYFERALDYEPASVQTLNNLGRSLLAQRKPEQARLYLEPAAAAAPGNTTVRANLVLAGGEPPPAAAALSVASASKVKAPSLWVERTSRDTQTLVTRPDPGLLAFAASTGRDPRLLHVAVPDRHRGATVEPAQRASHQELAAVRLEVSNGAGRDRMAALMRDYLAMRDVTTGRLTNADHFGYAQTIILYRPGFVDDAHRLAELLPIAVALEEREEDRSDLVLRLGHDLLGFVERLRSSMEGTLT